MKAFKQVAIVVVFGICGLILSSCGQKSAQEIEKKEEAQVHKGLVVINVLDKKLFDDCHIKGSINIPVEDVAQCEKCIDKEAQVVVYCSNYLCSSSDYVARKLKENGFKNVAVYAGGTAEWYQKGLPVEGPHESAYLTNVVESMESMQQDGVALITVDDLARKMGVATSENTQVAQTDGLKSAECK